MPTDMKAEIRRLEPLVATAIEEAKRVNAELAIRIITARPELSESALRLKVWAAFAVEHNDLSHAEMIAVSRAEGLDDDAIAQELSLVEAQGMW